MRSIHWTAAALLATFLGGGCRSAPAGGPSQAPAVVAAPSAASGTGEARFAGRTHGAAAAPVTVYEMSDFQCPYCRQFFMQSWAALDAQYVQPGKVRWIFVNVPKPRMHPNSPRAAQFATCARRQGKFWPMHDQLFENQPQWAPASMPDSLFRDLATRAGLDPGKLERCLADPGTAAELAADAAAATAAGVRGVPAFVADGRIIVLGAQPVDSFRVALDALLQGHR